MSKPHSPPPRYFRTIFPDFNYQWLVEEIKENLPR